MTRPPLEPGRGGTPGDERRPAGTLTFALGERVTRNGAPIHTRPPVLHIDPDLVPEPHSDQRYVAGVGEVEPHVRPHHRRESRLAIRSALERDLPGLDSEVIT